MSSYAYVDSESKDTGEKSACDMKDTLKEFRRKGIQFLAAAFSNVDSNNHKVSISMLY